VTALLLKEVVMTDEFIGTGATLGDVMARFPAAGWLLDWYGIRPEREELEMTLLAFCARHRLSFWEFTAELLAPETETDWDEETEDSEIPAI
jgi:hypothetical protein